MQVLLAINLVLDQKVVIDQLSHACFAVDVVVREKLRFDLLGATLQIPVIVGEVPRANEQ